MTPSVLLFPHLSLTKQVQSSPEKCCFITVCVQIAQREYKCNQISLLYHLALGFFVVCVNSELTGVSVVRVNRLVNVFQQQSCSGIYGSGSFLCFPIALNFQPFNFMLLGSSMFSCVDSAEAAAACSSGTVGWWLAWQCLSCSHCFCCVQPTVSQWVCKVGTAPQLSLFWLNLHIYF